jgi:hypothetical protein
MRFEHHNQPPDEERRTIEAANARRILEAMEVRPLANVAGINSLMPYLATPDRLDGWETTRYLADALGDAYDLYWTDLGLLRPCFGNEHAAAVMDGSEIDYAPLFYDAPHILQIIRMVNLLQDSGKVLSIAEAGNNFSQSFYNRLVSRNVLDSIYDAPELGDSANGGMHPLAKKAAFMLIDQDIIGGILQNRNVSETLAMFQSEWPAELLEYRDDLLLASYLSDASAHSAYRLVRNPRNGYIEPAVRQNDSQLTFLFQKHRNGAVTLTPDRSELLLHALPYVNRLRHLLADELSPYPREADVFEEVLNQKLTRHQDITRYVPALGETAIWLRDESNVRGEDTVRIAESERYGKYVNRITQYRDDSYRDALYYLPGDGRIWGRFVEGNDANSFQPIDYFDYPPDYEHPDPEVTEMQRNIIETMHAREKEEIGLPLASAQAWQVIHDTENLL